MPDAPIAHQTATPENDLAALQKENVKLARQLARLQATMDRNKTISAAMTSISSMRAKAKQKQEVYMQLLLEHSPDIIILLDGFGRFTYGTSAFLERAHIASIGLLTGKLLSEIFAPFGSAEWAAGFVQRLQDAARDARALFFEEIIDIEGGNPRRYEVSFTPIHDAISDLNPSLMMLHDITDIRLAQENAEKAREEAERASMAKSDFLANMSHEIRTPLNAIIGMTAIGKNAQNVEKKDYALHKIEDASIHLLGVINDILDMSKIEANKLELTSATFNFERMLSKVVNVVTFRVEEKRQSFFIHIDPAIPANLTGDDQRLAQIIANLLGNAVKFTPEEGFITLEAKLLSEHDGVCSLQISVSDSGIGISEEQQTRLFSSFQQADNSTSRQFGGTGLGLAISKRIVELMSGTIWIESTLGKGAIFRFTALLQRAPDDHTVALGSAINRGDLRILVVDDMPELREYFEETLHRMGIRCDVAAGGEAACALLDQNGSYHICFIDWKMPGMDGMEVARYIKSRHASNSVVVMISSTEWGVIEETATQAGVDRFLPKPIFPSAIVDCINECLGVSGIRHSSEIAARTTEEEQPNFKGYCILLAEDVEINREIVCTLLEPTELCIDCAENGEEAVRLFSKAPDKYDMIFMDVQMPRMDGYEATRTIRNLDAPRARSIPIVAMTANVFREDVERCLAAGMNDHIGKPLDLSMVIAKLRQYIQDC